MSSIYNSTPSLSVRIFKLSFDTYCVSKTIIVIHVQINALKIVINISNCFALVDLNPFISFEMYVM